MKFNYLFGFYFKRLVPAVKRLPVLHHSIDYISISFGITEPILVALKIEYCLSWCKGAYAASQTTVDSRYLEIQGTHWNTSRYPYFDISELREWGKQ